MVEMNQRPSAVICPYCNDYLEFFDEGIDPQGHLYDLYICIECGNQMAIEQGSAGVHKPRYPWDPPDGLNKG